MKSEKKIEMRDIIVIRREAYRAGRERREEGCKVSCIVEADRFRS